MNPVEFATVLDDGIEELRGYLQARMKSTATVRRPTGGTTPDPTTGFLVPAWEVVYTGPFRLGGGSSGDGGSVGVTIGGVTFEEATAVGHFPAATTGLRDDDLIEVTAGEWAGEVFRIVAATRYDQKTARRLPIVEAQRPEEWA